MLRLNNREELLRAAQLVPLIEEMALCVSSGDAVEAIIRADSALGRLPGWIVYADDHNGGIALHPYEVSPAATLLRRCITFASHAQKVVRCFGGGQGRFPLYLCEEEVCPAEWHIFKVTLKHGDFLCAVSFPAPELVFGGVQQVQPHRKVPIALQAQVEWVGGISIGASQVFDSIFAGCIDQEIFGYLRISEERIMTFSSLRAEQQQERTGNGEVRVRLDLGDIELSLPEVAALRVGSELELEVELPLRCYLRIGSTTLAVGEIVRAETGLRITLTEIHS
jgi:flagellar motor switch/type III secretory pathway protein FliN